MALPLWVALGIPLTVVFVGAMGKKLTRGTSWRRSDFYLGPQLCLATFLADALYIAELSRESNSPRLTTALLLLVFVFGLYTLVLTIHQDWEGKDHRPKRQFFWLVIVSNSVGGGLFAVFVLLVKGVQ